MMMEGRIAGGTIHHADGASESADVRAVSLGRWRDWAVLCGWVDC